VTRPPTISDKLAYYALILFEKPIGLLPTSWMWRFGAVVGSLAHSFAKKRKAIVQANLKIVQPFKKVQKIVSIENQDKLSKLDDQKGCIMLLFHMGNWEILTRVAHMIDSDKPSAAMYRPLNNPLINDFITNSREKDGTLLFGRKKGLIQASKFIRDGGMLGILADQHSGNAGIKLPLFGKETSITPLPSMLAQKYDCPIMPVTVETTAPGKWAISFDDPINIPKDLDKDEAAKLLLPLMEKVMFENSSDVFWLHDRWKIKHEL